MNTVHTCLPELFREALSNAGMPAIDEWWNLLGEYARQEMLSLWQDCQGQHHQLTIQAEASIVDEPDPSDGNFWPNDFYEYLVNHELYYHNTPVFHICTQHPAAQDIARKGILPHDFSCPLARPDCPMMKLLAKSRGRSVRFKLSVSVGGADGDYRQIE